MAINVYLDESGDLGWSLDKPYHKGGSSRYLTIAFAVCPSEKKHLLQRIVRKVYQKVGFNAKEELKGSSLSIEEKCYFAEQVRKIVSMNPDIIIGAITVNKSKVQTHIRRDANKLYNYMIRLAVLPKVAGEPIVNLIRDNKTIKVKSGNSLIDYLQIEMWFEHKKQTTLVDIPSDSKGNKNLIFIDWINNLVWGKYELGNNAPYDIIKNVMTSQKLFF